MFATMAGTSHAELELQGRNGGWSILRDGNVCNMVTSIPDDGIVFVISAAKGSAAKTLQVGPVKDMPAKTSVTIDSGIGRDLVLREDARRFEKDTAFALLSSRSMESLLKAADAAEMAGHRVNVKVGNIEFKLDVAETRAAYGNLQGCAR